MTVTPGHCHIFSLFPSRHFPSCTLLLLFESLVTHSPNYDFGTVTYFFAYISPNFQYNFSVLIMLLLHNVLVTFLHCFQVYTSLYCFLFSYWRPASIIIVFKRLHIFGFFLGGIILLSFVWMSQKVYIKVSPLLLTEPLLAIVGLTLLWLSHKVLFFPFESFKTHFIHMIFFSWRMRTLHLTAFNSKFPFLFDFLSYNVSIFEQFKSNLSNRNMSLRNNSQSFL